MLFSEQVFLLLFLPAALAAYYLAARTPQVRLRILLVASFIFYGWWDPRFVPLLGGSILGNWLLARWYAHSRPGWAMVLGIALNLGLLALFKYANFLADGVLALAGRTHEPWDILLPLGISFFTFEQISYLVDLRRGRAPQYSLEQYANFVMFFPHLIAGPIIRHGDLIPQFALDPGRPGVAERIGRGMFLFTLGLAKKVLIADALAPHVDARFADVAAGTAIGGGDAWFGALAFTLQLYFDFSAYSEMAMGLAMMFGYELPLNFDRPYRSLSVREFWRRWHMTLSRLIRDYVYIAMGGNRRGEFNAAVAGMTTMLLCGLWHGAGWTFVAWGGLHGAGIVLQRQWERTGLRLPAPAAWLLTLLFVILGWVLFRAQDFGTAWDMVLAMAGTNDWGTTVSDRRWRLVAIGFAIALLGPTSVELARRAWVSRRSIAVLVGVLYVAMALRGGYGRSIDFIYFQF
ncbi:MAG: MBOAT family protein [Gammaproteobacteria bacterium]